jgi:pilus assembly protein Flp/PilA
VRGKKAMIHLLCQLAKSRKGATAVEYGLILAMIVLAMIGALQAVAGSTAGLWDNISAKVAAAH